MLELEWNHLVETLFLWGSEVEEAKLKVRVNYEKEPAMKQIN